MTVSIIIRAKNEEVPIARVLKTICGQTSVRLHEVIIVDSGSTDSTVAVARRFGATIVHIAPQQFTYGYALNFGIRHSSGEIVCSLSAHCTPCSNEWLAELTEPIRQRNAHATYGRQVPVKGINPFEELFLKRQFPEGEHLSGRVPFSNANCAFIRRMWEEVQFDERIPSWEDYLWYLKTRDSFQFRYAPRAVVTHSHPFSFGRLMHTAIQDGRAFRYLKERRGVDIFSEAGSGAGKLRYAAEDLLSHSLFFLKQGYYGPLFMLPFVKLYSYMNYLRGYYASAGGSPHGARA
jgi:glycosyltransferase involved in cell wall biosynthesis